MMNIYKRITTDYNWREVDQLNEIDLLNNEILSIQWPDGTKSIENIVVLSSSCETSDMGQPWTIKVRQANALAKFRGIDIFIPLKGLLAKRIKRRNHVN